jgi:adenylylsulfate kinase
VSWAIWITGIPGSGKSTLARAAAAELRAMGDPVRVLELDEIRKMLTPEPRYSEAERDIVYRALGYMAQLLTEAGVPVIIDATAHHRLWRDLARAAIPRFAEVQLLCPIEIGRQRERSRRPGHAPAGIYDRAGQPGASVPGVDVPYEPALAPELVVDTAAESVPDAAHRIAELAQRLAGLPPDAPIRSTGWAIWITGRPGSGKSTVAERVAQTLSAREMPVRVLDLAAVRRRLLPDRRGSEAELEIVHRALAYAAKLLTEVGVAVIVDATAPRRAWRQAARNMIPRFAEVQLLCPSEVCVERERAARWRLGLDGAADPRRPPAPAEPDVVVDYEESLRPELVLRTDIHDAWAAAQQVLFLAQRLHRAITASFDAP